MRNPLPKDVIEKTREVAHEKDQPDTSEENEEETHNKRQRIRKLARRHVDNHILANDYQCSEAKAGDAPPLRPETRLTLVPGAVSKTCRGSRFHPRPHDRAYSEDKGEKEIPPMSAALVRYAGSAWIATLKTRPKMVTLLICNPPRSAERPWGLIS
jgi:hypothetical protein